MRFPNYSRGRNTVSTFNWRAIAFATAFTPNVSVW